MKVIKHGSRGPAVEDIQRRLIYLGYTLKKTGVDGVFLDDTQEAIREFQKANGLEITGEVDSYTWSILVDSTFAFGDRMLYLRYPFFQGRDIEILQIALNSLGFTCGDIDGVFGTYTEHAVIELQKNMNLEPDGVVGQETFATLLGLKHVWEDKKVISHSAARAFSTHRNRILSSLAIEIESHDEISYQVARRIKNLARASYDDAAIMVTYLGETTVLGEPDEMPFVAKCTLVHEQPDQNISPRFESIDTNSAVKVDLRIAEISQNRDAFASAIRDFVLQDSREGFVIKIPSNLLNKASKQGFQNTAVYILDSICSAYAGLITAV